MAPTRPNRVSTLLEFDTQFETARLVEIQQHGQNANIRIGSIGSITKIAASGNFGPVQAAEILENLTTIKEIRASSFTEVDVGEQNAKYLLCRVITSLIPRKTLEGEKCEFVCVVDEPQGYNALRLQITANCNSSHEKLLHPIAGASDLLPIGSILLVKNPANYFYFKSTTLQLECESDELLLLDPEIHENLLKGIEWKGKIPSKYTNICADGNSDLPPPSLSKSRQYEQQSTTGQAYPVHQWLAAESSTALQHLNCAEYEGPAQVQNVAGKGRGLVATEFIPKGSLVMAKRAFVVSFIETELEAVTGCKTLTAPDMAAFGAWTDLLNANKIGKRIAVEPELGKAVYELYAGPRYEHETIQDTTTINIDRIVEICKYNGIANRPHSLSSSKNSLPQDCQLFTQQMTTGLWIRCSYINHSCSDANAFWRMWGDFLFIRAFADIQPGQEILMSYRGGITQCSYLERKSALFIGMGFKCDCALCQIESGLNKGTNQDIMDLLGEVQGMAQNLNGLGSQMYRFALVGIIEELKVLFDTATEGSIKMRNLLEVYLYQPYKLLAMTLLAEAQDQDGSARDGILKQVIQLLDKAHDLIQNTSDCSKSIGCCLDLIAILTNLADTRGVARWLAVLRKNLQVVYGCSEHDFLEDVVDLFLKKYKINKNSIHCS